MSQDETIPVKEVVEAYLTAAGYTPAHAHLVLAELDQSGERPLDLLGEPLPYFIKDGEPVIERERFDALMARQRAKSAQL